MNWWWSTSLRVFWMKIWKPFFCSDQFEALQEELDRRRQECLQLKVFHIPTAFIFPIPTALKHISNSHCFYTYFPFQLPQAYYQFLLPLNICSIPTAFDIFHNSHLSAFIFNFPFLLTAIFLKPWFASPCNVQAVLANVQLEGGAGPPSLLGEEPEAEELLQAYETQKKVSFWWLLVNAKHEGVAP